MCSNAPDVVRRVLTAPGTAGWMDGARSAMADDNENINKTDDKLKPH